MLKALAAAGVLALLAAAGMLAALAASAGRADAQSRDKIAELKEERRQLQQEAAEAEAGVDAAEADAEQLVAALEKAQAAVDAQQASVDAAQSAVAEADARLHDAEADIAALEQELAEAQADLREAVITSFVSFQTPTGAGSFLDDDPWRNARDETLAAFVTGSGIDRFDDLRRIGALLEERRANADQAAADAQAHSADMSEGLAELNEAKAREARLTEAAEDRLETRLYEAQALQDLDAQLSAQIRREERLIAAALARARAAEAARRAAAAARRAAATLPSDSSVTLVSVRGIVVNAAIAEATEGLLSAMKAEGFRLGGGGYRSASRQIALRKAHCGTSEYAVWQMPASRCRPPTARPGRSDHETGRAIDFTYNGRIISSRSSAVFRALQNIAPRFGFVNLRSEPWHWSNT